MAAYSHFLGSAVKVQYRLGDVVLSASGTFIGDSGRSVFLEQHLEQRGKRNYFRWEIPYPYILRIEPAAAPADAEAPPDPTDPPFPKAAAASASASVSSTKETASGASSIFPFPDRRKTA